MTGPAGLIGKTAFILFVCSGLFGQNIAVTSLKLKDVKDSRLKNKTQAEIVFNNAIKIKDIQVTRVQGKAVLRFPAYVSKKNLEYPQVILVTKEANEVVRKAVETKEVQKPGNKQMSYRINKFIKIEDKERLKALASVVFNEALEIECKIFSGKDGLWVSWPSVQNVKNKRWRKQVVITDYKLRESVERGLLNRFEALDKKNNE